MQRVIKFLALALVTVCTGIGIFIVLQSEKSIRIGFIADISGHEYFQETLKRLQPFWSPSFMSEQTDIPVSSLSIPYDKGVITLFFSLNKIGEYALSPELDRSGRIILITDQKGVFLAHPDEKKVSLREYDPLFRDHRKLWNRKALNFILVYKEQKYLAHIIFINESGWKIALYQPLSSFYEPIKNMAAWLGILTLIVTTAAVFFGKMLNKGISDSSEHTSDFYKTPCTRRLSN